MQNPYYRIEGNTWTILQPLDEAFPYQEFFSSLNSQAFIDLSQLSYLTAEGIEQWYQHSLNCPHPITLINCAADMIDKIPHMPPFLGPQTEIKSFYVKFVCDECSEEERSLFQAEANENDPIPNDTICPNCGSNMGFAHEHHDFLHFLTHHKAS